MSEHIRISEAEGAVMKLLWEKEPLSAGEIIERLQHQTDWSDQTIKTFLNRLLNKEAIRFEKTGRTYLYYPIVTRDQYMKAENRSFLNRVYDGAVGLMCAKFLEDEKLSESDIEQLQQLLDKKRKDG
ncbi:BlaI/MecI/CopY family transcriptional regulator [Cohnella ginsengisoli]|uniref:BlaI/MecI/CopY family transcriptional regulator n=1 Tax=Cohnella ginsengisoli TaxID=425004 RepID=A0A9X4KML0_9BACL|nr:BlaI/MecI/CopY family transcriptional regulator [Cohnella ginsengisoli]MDG0794788.1 BlaI/MecI/CopY family transcriptional regulator [Cohnella ginsengisoli]